MLSDRFLISDGQWDLIEPHCLGKKSDPGRTGGDARLFVEAVLWIARTGAPWRDLPAEFGNGIRFSHGSDIGFNGTYFIVCSMSYPKISTSNIR